MAEALSDVDGIESLMNLTRKERAMIAEDTLQKLNLGWYSPSGNSSIHFSDDVTYSVNNSILYNENDLKNIERKDLSDDQRDSNPKIEIRLCTTLQSTQSLVKEIGEEHVGVLNFASAKNPGGGFRNGAQAQEESLCRTSSLYLSLTQNRFVDEFYDFHRRSRNGLYSHRIIYSPRVTFFKDDNGTLLSSPYRVGIVTCAAPNANLIHNQQILQETMRERIERILTAFELNRDENLVLGAFGCGVFRNNPIEVANTFKQLLQSNRFEHSFKRIIFAITNPQMCHVFEQVFNGEHIDEQLPLHTDRIQNNDRKTQGRKKDRNFDRQARQRKYQYEE